MNASDSAAVLVRARQGDEDAFGALVQQHSRRVFQLAFRMMGNEQDAEDVVQESFLRAYRQLNSFQARADFGTWLYRIVANCAVDLMRSRDHRVGGRTQAIELIAGAAAAGPSPERLALSAQLHDLIDDAMADLSAIERAAFTLRHHEGRSIDEICTTLNLGTSAAKHAVFRAVRKLRAALAPFRAGALAEMER